MRILVTGGAGYVGSHTTRQLLENGHEVWVFDNLTTGHRRAATQARFVQGELTNRDLLQDLLSGEKIDAVFHFAASALVGESVAHPDRYYQNNVVATLSLLEAMRSSDVRKIIFSSTTATYGVPSRVPICESERQAPINPYGFTKLVIEHALADYTPTTSATRPCGTSTRPVRLPQGTLEKTTNPKAT
jgi:UDP-glucose 4-epimerase